MNDAAPTVFVVEDDPSFRRSTERVIRSDGFRVQSFGAAGEFLTSNAWNAHGCLVLDVHLPDLSGLDLQRELASWGSKMPIIFMTGHGDVPTSVRAMKAGAIEFLTKPFAAETLLDAVREAIERDRSRREQEAVCAELRARYESLTPRERQVMTCVVEGLLNKQTAAELGAAEKTVKFHRAHLMQKMRAASVAELVRMAAQLEPRDLQAWPQGVRCDSRASSRPPQRHLSGSAAT